MKFTQIYQQFRDKQSLYLETMELLVMTQQLQPQKVGLLLVNKEN